MLKRLAATGFVHRPITRAKIRPKKTRQKLPTAERTRVRSDPKPEGGALAAKDHTKFSQILGFDSGRKMSCLMQKCKIKFENIDIWFYKQN